MHGEVLRMEELTASWAAASCRSHTDWLKELFFLYLFPQISSQIWLSFNFDLSFSSFSSALISLPQTHTKYGPILFNFLRYILVMDSSEDHYITSFQLSFCMHRIKMIINMTRTCNASYTYVIIFSIENKLSFPANFHKLRKME